MPQLRRVVVLSLDAVRFDALDAQPARDFRRRHGLEGTVMPNLERFARSGTLFRTASTTAPYTTAAHASLFTGQLPPRHGLRAFYRNALGRGVRTLAELLGEHGFETWFLSDRPELFEPVGLARGFDRVFGADGELLGALERPQRPVLAFAHLFDAHKPYLVSGTCAEPGGDRACRRHVLDRSAALGLAGIEADRSITDLFWSFQRALLGHPAGVREMLAMYWAGLGRFDRERLGRYFELLGDPRFLEDSLVVVVSDHGEDLVPGQLLDHAGDLTEGKLRVLLAVAGPGWPPAGQCDRPVSLVDVLPTCLADAVGPRAVPDVDGRDLRARLDGSAPLRAAYAESWAYQSDEDPTRPERGPLAGRNWMLYQRCLRSPQRLWVLRGLDLGPGDERLRRADDAEYVRLLYRGLLGRYEDAHGSAGFVAGLRAGRHTRRGLFRRVRWSRELRDHPRLVRFELARDPLTEHPIAAHRGRWFEACRVRRTLRRMEAAALEPPELEMSTDQESLVTERLQALGYLD